MTTKTVAYHIPEHLVKHFNDFVAMHAEMYEETNDGSQPEMSEMLDVLMEQVVKNFR